MSQKSFVAYYRVSTKAQGVSGLGLEAQREAVASYIRAVDGTLVAEFEDVESGKTADRPGLLAALDRCKQSKAMLVIAKLDRLSRNVSFISKLLDSGVEFIAADMPSANRLTIHIVAAIAEYEREQISARVKGALRAAIARGARVGNPRLDEVRGKALARALEVADQFARKMAPVVAGFEIGGRLSDAGLARLLRTTGYRTARGLDSWSAQTVKNLRARISALQTHTMTMRDVEMGCSTTP